MSKHNWQPTTNTYAVYKCNRCGLVAFDPHPLPENGCGGIMNILQPSVTQKGIK